MGDSLQDGRFYCILSKLAGIWTRTANFFEQPQWHGN